MKLKVSGCGENCKIEMEEEYNYMNPHVFILCKKGTDKINCNKQIPEWCQDIFIHDSIWKLLALLKISKKLLALYYHIYQNYLPFLWCLCITLVRIIQFSVLDLKAKVNHSFQRNGLLPVRFESANRNEKPLNVSEPEKCLKTQIGVHSWETVSTEASKLSEWGLCRKRQLGPYHTKYVSTIPQLCWHFVHPAGSCWQLFLKTIKQFI